MRRHTEHLFWLAVASFAAVMLAVGHTPEPQVGTAQHGPVCPAPEPEAP